MVFTFKPIEEVGIQIYRSWFTDETTRQRISYPDAIWANYVLNTPDVYCWTIWKDSDYLGVLQADVEKNIAYFVLIINPAFRGNGYCKPIIEAFMQLEAMQAVEIFEAQIEKDNIHSMKCHAAAGFSQTGGDAEFYFFQKKTELKALS